MVFLWNLSIPRKNISVFLGRCPAGNTNRTLEMNNEVLQQIPISGQCLSPQWGMSMCVIFRMPDLPLLFPYAPYQTLTSSWGSPLHSGSVSASFKSWLILHVNSLFLFHGWECEEEKKGGGLVFFFVWVGGPSSVRTLNRTVWHMSVIMGYLEQAIGVGQIELVYKLQGLLQNQ